MAHVDRPGSPETPRPPLAEGEVRFVGDPVVLVVAESRALAEDAAELVEVDYEPLPAVVDYTTAEHADALVHEATAPTSSARSTACPPSALDDVFAAAAHVVSETIHQQAYAPVPMEGRGLVVDYARATGELTIYAATQSPHEVRLFCSRLLGMPEHRIRVVIARHRRRLRAEGHGPARRDVPDARGAEGRRTAEVGRGPPREPARRRASRATSTPTVKMAFDADGAIQAAHIDFVSDCGAYPTPWPVVPAAAVGMLFPGPYRVPRAGFATKTVYTNTVGRTAYRGPWQFETLAREVLLDIAARRDGHRPGRAAAAQPAARRRAPVREPQRHAVRQHLAARDVRAGAGDARLRRVPRRAGRRPRADGRYLGVGVSNYVEPSTPGYGFYATEAATIRIEPSGAVNVYIAGGSAGNSLETTVVQLAADALGVNIEDVNTIQGDTAVTGFGAGAAGSRSGSMTAGAVRETATILRERIARHRRPQARSRGRRHRARRQPRRACGARRRSASRSREIAALAYFEPRSLPPGVPAGLEASARVHRRRARSIWVNATHVCTCEVDVTTGAVKLLRYIVSEDCGPMINPNVVEGQIAGGVVQGIGGVLFEHLAYDDDGNPLATTFMDYLLPDRGRGAGHRVRPHRDAEPRPRRLQGRGRRRRDRRAAGRRQRGGRRALAVRRDGDALAADAVAHRRAPRRSPPTR